MMYIRSLVLALLAASAAAFTPTTTSSRNSALSATAELEGLIGTDIETGSKIVSGFTLRRSLWGTESQSFFFILLVGNSLTL
jgi:hypothetical protein